MIYIILGNQLDDKSHGGNQGHRQRVSKKEDVLQPEVILLSLIQQNDMLSVPLKNLKAYIALIPVIQHLNLLI